MATAQKTIVKTPAKKVAAKTPAKTPAKTTAKTTAKPASVVSLIVKEVAARIEAGSAFYTRALQYHAAAKTVFPRARNAARIAALKAEDVTEVMRQHDAKILAAGNGNGQAVFDVYMANRKG